MSSSLTGRTSGGMPEWFNGHLSKRLRDESLTGVRIPLPPPAPVAQLDRAVASGAKDWGFESLQGHMAEKKKPVKREISAGGAVFRKQDKELLWLLVQPKRNDSNKPIHWRLAKGIIEEGESTEATARREVEEEAGIKVKVLDKIGKTTYFYTFKGQRIFKIIIFYLMQYQGETGNGVDGIEIEKSQWLPYQEAYQKLTFDSEKKILGKAKKILVGKEKQQRLF